MRLTLPIWIFEPTTSLTRIAESFEFSHLLDAAASSKHPLARDLLVTAFIVSSFAHTERVKKPFNPVLGETYDFVDRAANLRFYAEQVSHHPPISAAHVEGRAWLAGEVVDAHMVFQGPSVELTNVGTRFVHLLDSGDRYTWTLPRTTLSNFLLGAATVDHFGVAEIRNHATGTRCTLDFPRRAWFALSQCAVTGELCDADGATLALFRGVWNDHVDWEPVAADMSTAADLPSRLWSAGERKLSDADGGGPNGPFANCTHFTKHTVRLDDHDRARVLPTDSRLRPDRLALQAGDSAFAAEEKVRVETLQRERRAVVAHAVANGGEPHTPRFFERTPDGKGWKPKGTYWSQARKPLSDDERTKASLW